MGEEVAAPSYTREQRQRYREKVRQNLDVFEQMLAHSQLRVRAADDRDGDRAQPGRRRATSRRWPTPRCSSEIADPDYQTELGAVQHRAQRAARGRCPATPRSSSRTTAAGQPQPRRGAGQQASAPTSSRSASCRRSCPSTSSSDWMSANTRYAALNEAVFDARGEDIYLDIEGPTGERLATYADTIAPESACTSVQLHLQVGPAGLRRALERRAGAGRPAARARRELAVLLRQAAAGPRPASSCSCQATDTRSVELKNQGVRPRVFFGERWITSIFDLFEENVRYFPALLPEVTDEDPVGGARRRARRRGCRSCGCTTAPSTAGTGPIYDIVDGTPHLRVENRVLPAGPTRRRRPRQRGVLLRRRRGAGRRRPAGLDQDELRRGRAQLPRRAPAAASTRGLYWPGFGEVRGRRAGAAPPAAAGPRGAGSVGRLRGGARPLPRRSSRGAARPGTQRRRLAGRHGASGSRRAAPTA